MGVWVGTVEGKSDVTIDEATVYTTADGELRLYTAHPADGRTREVTRFAAGSWAQALYV